VKSSTVRDIQLTLHFRTKGPVSKIALGPTTNAAPQRDYLCRVFSFSSARFSSSSLQRNQVHAKSPALTSYVRRVAAPRQLLVSTDERDVLVLAQRDRTCFVEDGQISGQLNGY